MNETDHNPRHIHKGVNDSAYLGSHTVYQTDVHTDDKTALEVHLQACSQMFITNGLTSQHRFFASTLEHLQTGYHVMQQSRNKSPSFSIDLLRNHS